MRLFTQRIGSELTPCVITTGNGTFLYYVCYVLSFSTSFLKIELRKNNHHVKNRHANFLAVAKRGVIFRFAIYAIKNWLIWNLKLQHSHAIYVMSSELHRQVLDISSLL